MLPHKFYPKFYVLKYPELHLDRAKAHDDYVRLGMMAGRCPNPFFDPVFYLQMYSDLRKAYGKTNYAGVVYHWIACGIPEGRQGCGAFSIKHYAAQHPDVNFGLDYARWYQHLHTNTGSEQYALLVASIPADEDYELGDPAEPDSFRENDFQSDFSELEWAIRDARKLDKEDRARREREGDLGVFDPDTAPGRIDGVDDAGRDVSGIG